MRASARGWRGWRRGALALATLLLALTASAPAGHAQDGVDPAGDPTATGAGWPDFQSVLWSDRSESLLSSGTTAVVVSPADGNVIYAAGRGFVSRSDDGGNRWRPVLLLVGADLATVDESSTSEPLVLSVDPEDLDDFDDSDALDQFETLRDQTLEELEAVYGEELAESLISDLEDDLRQEAFTELVDQATVTAAEQDYQARYQGLVDAGFPEADAAALAQDPLTVYRLVIHPDSPDAVYAATGRGLFRTTDAGDTWQRLLLGLGVQASGVLDVAVARGGATLIAATATGVRVSTDAGRTWSTALGAMGDEPVRALVGDGSDERFYAAGLAELARTDDAGVTWISLTPLDFAAADVRRLVAVRDSRTVVAATESGLFRSDDGGESWQDIGRGLPETGALDVALLRPDSANGLLVLGDRRAFVSTDGGTTWTPASSGLVGQRLATIAVGASADQLWLGADSGIFVALLGQAAAIEEETVRQLRRIWDDEPTPAQVIWAAVTFNQLADIPVDAWHTRLVASKFAPRFEVELFWFQENVDQEQADFEAPLVGIDPDRQVLVQQDRRAQRRTEFEWEIWALWDLGRLLYDSSEHAIESASLQLHRERRRLVTRVVRLVLARRALQLRVATEGVSELEPRLDALLELEESAAMLDALTGGFFTASIATRQ